GQRCGRSLRFLDPLWVLRLAQLGQASLEFRQVTAAGGLFGDLAKSCERGCLPHEPPFGKRLGVVAHREPCARLGGLEGAEIDASADLPRDEDARELLPRSRESRGGSRDPLDVLRKRHAETIGPWRLPPARAMRASCSHRSDRRTTATRACSRSAKTRAGG